MDDCLVIALFRHGITEENKRHAYIGWTDVPLAPEAGGLLTPSGKVPGPYGALFSSDLRRCLETAQLLFPAIAAHPIRELRELHFGSWEGAVYEELKHDDAYRRWLDDPFSLKPPGGESFNEFTGRLDRAWETIVGSALENNGRSAAVVTHGGPIRYFLSKYAPAKKPFWEWRVDPGSGIELVWSAGGQRGEERCTLLREVPLMERPSGCGTTTI